MSHKPAFDPFNPSIAQEFMSQAEEIVSQAIGTFEERVAVILDGLEESHEPWIEQLLLANRPKQRVVLPKFYEKYRL